MKNITEKEFRQLATYVKDNFGINLFEKKPLIVGRLHNYLLQNNIRSFADYYDMVKIDDTGVAAAELINKLTTNHTYFLREEAHFNYFKSIVLPYLFKAKEKSKDLRIWSAGCSTGEEPYTLAMIISDFLNTEKEQWDSKILATDISRRVLEAAQNGVYSREQLEPLNKAWKKKYFNKISEESYIIKDSLKNEVIFRIFNLMNISLPFKKKFDVIFCRNVMIYFDSITKIELVNRFYEHTEPGGYLFIGHSESLIKEEIKYKYIMPAVYRKE